MDLSELGSNPFEDLEVEYIWQPYQTFLDPHNQQPGDGVINYRYFEQYKNQLVVINFASEHWNNFEHWVCEWLDRAGINFLILTHDPAKHQTHPRMFYYPHWYQLSRSFWLECYPDNITVGKNRNYSVGCLNGSARPHRIANFLKLKKQPYWDKTCVSFYNNEPGNRSDELILTADEVAEWLTIQSLLPAFPFVSKEIARKTDLIVPHLTDSYLHLVTETTILPGVFLSEKTWKPIASAVPFVMWGNPKTMEFLKNQGVDIYDDVIDHKYYDTEQDARLRLNKLHEIIDNLMLQGVDKIYNQLSARAIDNQTKFFNSDFNQQYHNIIIDAIKKYT